MLQMRPSCECCDKDLPPELAGARICSFECTFCEACATTVLSGACPNCGGERFRGLQKNAAHLLTLFALSNLWMARRQLMAMVGAVRPKAA